MKFFLAGVMQGSHLTPEVHDQSYRTKFRALLEESIPAAEVYDPWADHNGSLDYDDRTGREVFLRHNQMCGEVDAVIAYVPHASMGTAIEIWEAHRNARSVFTISPFTTHWAIKFCSDRVYEEIDDFVADLRAGTIEQLIREKMATRTMP